MTNKLTRQRVLIIAGFFIIIAPLLIYAFGTQFIRYMADDFCIASASSITELIGGASPIPFTAGLIDYPIHAVGVSGAPLFCVLWLTALGFGLFIVIREVLHDTVVALLAALLLLGIVLACATNLVQSIYWQSGRLKISYH